MENRRPKTENEKRRQKTGDRKQKNENGRPKTKNGIEDRRPESGEVARQEAGDGRQD